MKQHCFTIDRLEFSKLYKQHRCLTSILKIASYFMFLRLKISSSSSSLFIIIMQSNIFLFCFPPFRVHTDWQGMWREVENNDF